MLHPISPVLVEPLRAVLAFERSVLEFACRSDLAITQPAQGKPRFQRGQIDSHFGASADWVWSHTSLCSPVDAVHKAVQGNPGYRQQVLAAFDNDVAFDQHIDDHGFQFAVRRLPAALLGPVKALLVLFYDLLSADGGFAAAVTGSKEVSRDALVQAFWSGNPDLKVCPACDGKRPDSLNGRVYGHCDHHFPKGIHPALSIHPLNLVPICAECNASFKLERDATEKSCLAEMFLPYRRPAFGPARAVVSRTASGAIIVSIEDEPGAPPTRVEALDHVYQLLGRWHGRLHEYAKASIQNNLRRQLTKWRAAPGAEADQFRDQRDCLRLDRGRVPDAILSEAYCEFAAGDADECQALVSQLGSAASGLN